MVTQTSSIIWVLMWVCILGIEIYLNWGIKRPPTSHLLGIVISVVMVIYNIAMLIHG